MKSVRKAILEHTRDVCAHRWLYRLPFKSRGHVVDLGHGVFMLQVESVWGSVWDAVHMQNTLDAIHKSSAKVGI